MAVVTRSVSAANVFEAKIKLTKTTAGPLSIKTDEDTLSYEVFVLEKSCSLSCQRHITRVLNEEYGCTNITLLKELQYIEARCDGIGSLIPYKIGEEIAQNAGGVKTHIDNCKLPSVSIGERYDARSVFTLSHRKTDFMNQVSRLIQSITGNLAWALDRIDQKEGTDGKLDLSCFPNLGKGVTIYVLDTGCRNTHEDLQGRTTLKAVARHPTPLDDNGHGTHIAGVAAGTNFGVCKLCNIVCIKTLDENNIGTIVDVVESIEYVLEQRKENPQSPAVAVMSLGASLDTDILDVAVNKLATSNVFPAVAAGNGFTDSCEWTPPRAKYSIAVGAIMPDDSLRFSSNYGRCVSILAPGEEIHSASHLGDSLYVSMSGTSMAAPYVAGVAALMLGEDPELTPSQILQKMKIRAKTLEDRLHSFKYSILRILTEDCNLYGFGGKGSQHTPEGLEPRQEDVEIASPSSSISRNPLVSPTFSESSKPLNSFSPSILPSSLPSPSSSPSISLSSPAISPSLSESTPPTIISFPMPSESSSLHSTPHEAVSQSSSPTLSTSLSTSSLVQTPSTTLNPNVANSQSVSPTLWTPRSATVSPTFSMSMWIIPSQSLSASVSPTSTPSISPRTLWSIASASVTPSPFRFVAETIS